MKQAEEYLVLDSKDNHKKFSDYFQFLEVIGKGAFGTVVKAKSLKKNEECAVKILKKTMEHSESTLLRYESSILASLNHENIVKFKEVLETDTRILISMELVKGGSLRQIIKNRLKNKWFTEDECKTIMRHIFLSLEYIHSKNIVHRDLKPENILVQDQNDFTTLRISDFGLSTTQQSHLSKQCGTTIYMAPELLDGKVYSKPVDIWSAGIIMFMLLNRGQHPYFETGDTEEIMREKLKNIKNNNQNMTQKQLSLYSKLITYEPYQRYTAYQCKFHPWITDSDYNEEPQTMEEMFKGWQTAQIMLKYMKTLMIMLKIMNIPFCNNNYLQKCKEISLENEQIVKEINRRQGRVTGIDKEFYDKLFSQYQEQIEELKKINQNNPFLIRLQSHESSKKNNEFLEKFNHLIKRKNVTLNQQKSTNESEGNKFEEVEVQKQEYQQDNEELQQEEIIEDEKKKLDSETGSPTISIQRKKVRQKKNQKNSPKFKPENIQIKMKSLKSNSQSPVKQVLPQTLVPPPISNNIIHLKQKFKIQLKPFKNEDILPDITPKNNKNEITTNFLFNQPKKSINRQFRKQMISVEREKAQVVQQNLIDVALGQINFTTNNYRCIPNRKRNFSICYPTSIYNYPIITSCNQDCKKKIFQESQYKRKSSFSPEDTERFQSFINKLKQQIK